MGKTRLIGDSAWTGLRSEDVSLACSSQIVGPVVLGFRRKLVLMPFAMATSLLKAELYAVIAHEFASLTEK